MAPRRPHPPGRDTPVPRSAAGRGASGIALRKMHAVASRAWRAARPPRERGPRGPTSHESPSRLVRERIRKTRQDRDRRTETRLTVLKTSSHGHATHTRPTDARTRGNADLNQHDATRTADRARRCEHTPRGIVSLSRSLSRSLSTRAPGAQTARPPTEVSERVCSTGRAPSSGAEPARRRLSRGRGRTRPG